MPVIAMTQEMGSLAKDVALALAQRLNLSVMRHEVQDHVAERMQVPKSLIGRLRGGKAGLVERLTTDQRSVALYTAEELFALAHRGNVVLRGWGATCLLRPVPHAVCVRITRPMRLRVEWLMQDLGIEDADMAEAEIRRSDQAHAARMNAQFGVTWGDPVLYDLVLNTERLSVDACVDQIVALTERPEFAETEASRQMLADLRLEARVRVALKELPETADVQVAIKANDRQVRLEGIVLDVEERNRTEAAVRAVPGVAGVDNALRVMEVKRRFTYSKT